MHYICMDFLVDSHMINIAIVTGETASNGLEISTDGPASLSSSHAAIGKT